MAKTQVVRAYPADKLRPSAHYVPAAMLDSRTFCNQDTAGMTLAVTEPEREFARSLQLCNGCADGVRGKGGRVFGGKAG